VSTFQSGAVPPDGRANLGDVPIRVTGAGNTSVGFFRGAGGYAYALVTNRDYKQPLSTTISLYVGKREVEVLDIPSNKWKKTGTASNDGNTLVNLELTPGGASLVRWL
jgi:hypothetical protein